jgi:hypothetical protein
MTFKWFGIFGIVCGLFSTAWAADKPDTITPHLNLLTINAIQTLETQGDELYLDVTAYPSNGKPHNFQVPKYPLYWGSNQLDKVNNVPIWQEPLANGEAVTLIISLVEQDIPLWGTDDLIGSIRVRLRNIDGKLESSWSMPNRVDAPTSILTKQGRAEKFQLVGENSNYEVFLFLK